ncbi:MAG: hypothetical protein FWG40_03100 [Peptococcaceae bacterium]|nr:hypothetical protein [Peptococcaceae bacterium]
MSIQIWEPQPKKEKVKVSINRTLKLNNVLIREISPKELNNENQIFNQMCVFIQNKGATTVGPVITYSRAERDADGFTKTSKSIMIQVSQEIEPDDPYQYEDSIRVGGCLYARFSEKLENLPYAYDKLGVYAFENDLRLNGVSYTISLNSFGTKLIADIFMPFERLVSERLV